MAEVMDMLQEEHRNFTRLLDFLERQIEIFKHAEEPDYDLMMDVLAYCRDYPDLYHHPKEDLVFEKLQARNSEAAARLGDLKAEHETLAELSRRFAAAIEAVLAEAALSRQKVVEVAGEFVDAMRAHKEMEDVKFFPAALASLTPEDWTDVKRAFEHRPDFDRVQRLQG